MSFWIGVEDELENEEGLRNVEVKCEAAYDMELRLRRDTPNCLQCTSC